VLVRAGTGWRVESGAGELRIPDTIQAVLASRIDALESAEKAALQTAAVVGREFWLEAVATLLEQPVDGVGQVLERLEERDLIRSRLSEREIERAYLFNHVLTRDVAYASLPRRSRSLLHDRLVGWLEGSSAISRPDLLAHHAVRSFEEAGHVLGLDPDDQERLRRRAFQALLRASAAFRTGNSIDTAVTHARRASLLVADPAEKARVEEALGEAAYFNYQGDEAWRHLRQAIALLGSSGTSTPRELARLAGRALETPLRRPGIMVHHPPEQEVFNDLMQALEWAGEGDSAERARLLMHMSFWRHAYPATDDHEPLVSDREALEAGELAAEIARRVGRPDIESAALDGVSANHIPDSNYAEAWKATHRRLALVGDIQDPEEVGDIHAMQCWIDFHRGHYLQVREFAETGFQQTIDQVPSVALHCLAWRGMSEFRLGDWDGVLDDFAVGVEILGVDRPEPPYFASGLWAVAAVVEELRGERAVADGIMETLAASRPNESGSDPAPLAPWIEFLGPLLARRGQVDLALRLIESSSFRRGTRRGLLYQAQCDTMLEGRRWEQAGEVAIAARGFGLERGLEALAPAADRLEGAALAGTGHLEDGIGLLRRAREAFSGLEARYDVALTELRLGEALHAAGRPDPELSERPVRELRVLGIADLPAATSL
jgi:tetratricopeptide (TPR) repeat protein